MEGKLREELKATPNQAQPLQGSYLDAKYSEAATSASFSTLQADHELLDDVILNDLVCVTLPYNPPFGAKLGDDIDGWTQCLLRRPTLNKIFLTSQFPSKPRYPPNVCFRIGPSRTGLGMFATRNLSMGDHILTERPLTITPTIIPMPAFAKKLDGLSEETRRRVILDEWERTFLQPCFSRLDPEAQAAFLDLANSHTGDGSGPILGVIRTNGFEVAGVVDPEPIGEYAAVCRTMCRINHSCSPSADKLFDIPSFSFQLRATRDIKEGEEIFVSYCNVLESAADRQEYLASYGIVCICTSCLPNTAASDRRRLDLKESIKHVEENYDTWIGDPLLADDYTIKISLHWIQVIEQEALEASDAYRHHLHAVFRAYVALGDTENAVAYGKLLGYWILGQSGREEFLVKMQDPSYLQGREDWSIRISSEYEVL